MSIYGDYGYFLGEPRPTSFLRNPDHDRTGVFGEHESDPLKKSRECGGQVVFCITKNPGVSAISKEKPVNITFPGVVDHDLSGALLRREVAQCYDKQVVNRTEYRVFYNGEDVTERVEGIFRGQSRSDLPSLIEREHVRVREEKRERKSTDDRLTFY